LQGLPWLLLSLLQQLLELSRLLYMLRHRHLLFLTVLRPLH
jgi:hypothetical protein